MNNTGERLRALRIRQSVTQSELSARLAAIGIKYSQARISRLERGWTPPTAELIACLAHLLDIPIEELQSPPNRQTRGVQDRGAIVLRAS